MTEIRVAVTGGSWISAAGHGLLSQEARPSFGFERAVIPDRAGVFARPLPRWGRFDDYTKLGCTAVALALRDAGLDDNTKPVRIGIVSSSVWESMSVDVAYYRTAHDADGALASPNLFSYTLPGIVHGECAVYFQLSGPTVCVGENGQLGIAALTTALDLLAADTASAIVAGWLDTPPDRRFLPSSEPECPSGALFAVLERHPRSSPRPRLWISSQKGQVRREDGQVVRSLVDVFGLS